MRKIVKDKLRKKLEELLKSSLDLAEDPSKYLEHYNSINNIFSISLDSLFS